MMKKIVTMVIISLFIMTSFSASHCISATVTAPKLNEIGATDQDEMCSITWSSRGNPPLPPVMWTEDFSTFYIPTPQNPDGDDVYYLIDWGDGTSSGWTEFVPSGTKVNQSHKWWWRGTYKVKVKAKDSYAAQSEWTILEVTMPRNKATVNSLLLRFLERFPLLEKVLLYLIK